MADTAYTNSGNQFAISTTPQNDDLDDHATGGFPSLTYVNIGKVGQMPEFGNDQNLPEYPVVSSPTTLAAKGQNNPGAGTIEVARDDDDAGQIALRAAAAPTNRNNYAYRIIRQDGSTDYFRALVTGPVQSGGGNDDFDTHTFNFRLNQQYLHVPAP